MRGFVPTPPSIVDSMIDRLFAAGLPRESDTILDPGCGEGAFIDGLIRWCETREIPLPRITGVESHPGRAKIACAKYKKYETVSIRCQDFLVQRRANYDYVIGNPPFVSILQISEDERKTYRDKYESARGRFDLYMLFFEQALTELKPDGRLVFITPEKYLYVDTCKALRKMLVQQRVVEIDLVNEDAFKGLVTYPLITTIDKSRPLGTTTFIDLDRVSRQVALPTDGASFLPVLKNHESVISKKTLEDVCIRVSCGIATGADKVFVRASNSVPKSLMRYAFPTISGRQLISEQTASTHEVMLIPYDESGKLTPESSLGELAKELSLRKKDLLKRSCAKKKPWYAFHDNVPFDEMLLPKILCKDITKAPYFWADTEGTLIPRHSVYYIVPKDPQTLDALRKYLNGPDAQSWLQANCQRAANGFLRVQSSVLRRLPIPDDLIRENHRKKSARRKVAA